MGIQAALISMDCDFSSCTIKDLKQFIVSHGGSLDGLIEKSDLIERCQELKTSAVASEKSGPSSAIEAEVEGMVWAIPSNRLSIEQKLDTIAGLRLALNDSTSRAATLTSLGNLAAEL